MRRFSVLPLLALLAGACSGDGSEVIDTAPVAWSIDSIPVLVILDTAVVGGGTLLSPSGATVLSSGEIAVSDAFASGVRFFESSGELVRTVGRGGEGPGEFNDPFWLGQCDTDSVFVWDRMQDQMTVIDAGGVIVREYPLAGTPMKCTRTGRFVAMSDPELPEVLRTETMTTRMRASFWVGDAEGESTTTLGFLPYGEVGILGKVTQIAISESRVYLGTADSASLDVYGMDGTHSGVIPLAINARPATEQNYEKALEARVEVFSDTNYREEMKQLMRGMSPMPEQLPLYTGLAVDPDNVIWVVLSSPGDGETRLHAVAEDGLLLANLHVPAEIVLYEVGRDYILGSFKDQNDVPGIIMYRLHRGAT